MHPHWKRCTYCAHGLATGLATIPKKSHASRAKF